MKKEFNHNLFSKNLNDAFFEIMQEKRANSDIRCRIETNKRDETVKVYIISKEKIIKIITFKEGKKYYKSIEGGNRNVD